MRTYIVQHFAYITKLSDLILNLDYAIAGMSEPSVKARLLAKWMDGVPEMLQDGRYFNKAAVTEEVFKDFLGRTEEGIRASYVEKFYKSQLLVLNLNLVMMCTTLELFFEHVFDIVFRAEPRTLLTLSSEKTISLEQVTKLDSYEEVIDSFRKKTSDRIIRDGVTEIVKSLDKIGIHSREVFSWDGFFENIQTRYAGWNENNLDSIFQERHSIVHDNQFPLVGIDDLFLRKGFFQNIITNVSKLCWHKFYRCGVILDGHDYIRQAIASSGGDPSVYPPPPNEER